MRSLSACQNSMISLKYSPLQQCLLVRTGKASDEEQLREYNRKIVRLGELTGKPVVATGDVHFLEPHHEIFRRILLSNKFDDCDEPLPLYFKTTDEMLEGSPTLAELRPER